MQLELNRSPVLAEESRCVKDKTRRLRSLQRRLRHFQPPRRRLLSHGLEVTGTLDIAVLFSRAPLALIRRGLATECRGSRPFWIGIGLRNAQPFDSDRVMSRLPVSNHAGGGTVPGTFPSATNN